MTDLEQKKAELFSLLGESLSLKASEERENEINVALNRLCPDPYWSDYVFHSDEFRKSDGKLDIEAIVNKIFSHKPILL